MNINLDSLDYPALSPPPSTSENFTFEDFTLNVFVIVDDIYAMVRTVLSKSQTAHALISIKTK